MIEIQSIKYTPQSQFHMLRHFESVDDATIQLLLNNGYTQNQIQQELSLTGSKFFSHFANDINELLEKILQHPYQKSTGINGNHIIELVLPIGEYPNGIGTKAVVSLAEISSSQKAQIFKEKNRNYELAHLLVDTLPVTNQCTLILKPIPEGYAFITAFSGESAMPIPDYKMSKSQFDACKTFWDEHVFLKKI
ncbi:MAG: hypothetical protein NT127_07640 [Sphingobacteriales bacterium]|nr:hypothetical protein [Sphingobacteriales bacterium]